MLSEKGPLRTYTLDPLRVYNTCRDTALQQCLISKMFFRDVFGDCALVGDLRWAGTFGVSGDFIARDNCRQIDMTVTMEVGWGRLRRLFRAHMLVAGFISLYDAQ